MKNYSLSNYLFLILLVGILSAGFHGLGFIKAIPWHLVYSDTLGFFDRVAAPGFLLRYTQPLLTF